MRIHPLILVPAILLSALLGCAGSASKAKEDSATGMDQATQYENDSGRRKVNANQGVGPLGSQTNPIKCDGTEGAAAYIGRLGGPNGERTTFTETGSAGVGPFGSIIYGYEISYPTPSGSKQVLIFFDPDFEGYSEIRPASGFRIR